MSNRTTATLTPCVTDAEIARRAYELWQARGCPMGESNDDWQTAEEQLLAEVRPRDSASPTCERRGRGVLLRFIDRLRQRAAM